MLGIDLQLKAGMPTILFADDEPAIRDIVARYLELGGHQVRLASNGSEALEQVRLAAPDLVVLDYQMGNPDGFEVCRDLKSSARFGHLPVLILTGRNNLETRLAGFDAGADDYLAKPFDPRELLARISALLRLASRGLQRNPTSGLPGGEAIQQEMEAWQARGETFAICYLDLDDFKPFGDRFGFRVADDVIRDRGAGASGGEQRRGRLCGARGWGRLHPALLARGCPLAEPDGAASDAAADPAASSAGRGAGGALQIGGARRHRFGVRHHPPFHGDPARPPARQRFRHRDR